MTLSYGARNLYATDASDGRIYQLVEDAASLVSGDTIIIVNRNEAQALSVFPLALGGVVPWEVMPMLMLSQVVLKTVYEVLALPVTIRVVRLLKQHTRLDTYDRDISYNIFSTDNSE